jgi:hypothetical protein
MLINPFSVLWELGLKTTQDKMAIKIMLTRFISMALKDQGVVGFWGAFVEDGIVILNPQEANFESIFFDVVNRVLIHEAQVQDFREDLSLIKLDRMPNTSARTLKPDDLLSFLLANTTYLGFIHNQSFLSKTVLYLAENYLGKIYPQESFNPGVELKAA